jgi:hypothetical protein
MGSADPGSRRSQPFTSIDSGKEEEMSDSQGPEPQGGTGGKTDRKIPPAGPPRPKD